MKRRKRVANDGKNRKRKDKKREEKGVKRGTRVKRETKYKDILL